MTRAEEIEVAATGSNAALLFEAEAGLEAGGAATVTPTDCAHDSQLHAHLPRITFQIKNLPAQ